MKYVENIIVVVGVVVCRFWNFSHLVHFAIEMRPGVWLHALFLSDVPLAILKCKTHTSKKMKGEWKKCTFSHWSFVRMSEKKTLHTHIQTTHTYIHFKKVMGQIPLHKMNFSKDNVVASHSVRVMCMRVWMCVCVLHCIHTDFSLFLLDSMVWFGFVWCGFNAPQRIVCWMFGYVKLPWW